MHRLMRIGGLALCLAVVSASCGDSTGTEVTNSFRGTFTGSMTGTRSGPSNFQVSSSNTNFFLLGWDAEPEMQVMFGPRTLSSGVPTVRTYQIGVEGGDYLSFLTVGSQAFGAVSGTVTFTTVSSKVVKGSFSVTYATGDGGEAVFTGTFNAGPCPAACTL